MKCLTDVRWWWVEDHYDKHLLGLVKYQGEVLVAKFENEECNKETDEWTCEYSVYRLPPRTIKKLIAVKQRFELFVGYHWTYSDDGTRGERFSAKKKPFWLWYYRLNGWLRLLGIRPVDFYATTQSPEADLVGVWNGESSCV